MIRSVLAIVILGAALARGQVSSLSPSPPFSEQAAKIESHAVESPVGRPIVFIHGWCSDDFAWSRTLPTLVSSLRSSYPNLYNDSSIYTVLFDGSSLHFYNWVTGEKVNAQSISSTVRFFVPLFFAPGFLVPEALPSTSEGYSQAFKEAVANIPIAVKADELARVIAFVQDRTFVRDVSIVSHSMGGLVARAYVQGFAGPLLGNSYFPGSSPYRNNVALLTTLNTPHKGHTPTVFEEIQSLLGSGCDASLSSFNLKEMDPLDFSTVIPGMNYETSKTAYGISPQPLPQDIVFHSIIGYDSSLLYGLSDRILTKDEQDLRTALQLNNSLLGNVFSTDNFFAAELPDAACFLAGGLKYLLHLLPCIGAQMQTLQLLTSTLSTFRLVDGIGIASLTSGDLEVAGGSSVIVSAHLNIGAPSNGAAVQLSSSNPVLQVPTFLNIAYGSSSGSFTAVAATPTAAQSAVITAFYGRGSAALAFLVVPPAPSANLSTQSLDFGPLLYILQSAPKILTITNTGTASMSIGAISVPGGFARAHNCPATLSPSASCVVSVVFNPGSLGLKQGSLSVATNAAGSPHLVSLSGTGIDVFLSLTRSKRPTRTGTGQAQALGYDLVFPATPEPVDIQIECLAPRGLGCSVFPRRLRTANVPVTAGVELRVRSQRLRSRSPQTVMLKVRVAHQGITKTIDIPVQLRR